MDFRQELVGCDLKRVFLFRAKISQAGTPQIARSSRKTQKHRNSNKQDLVVKPVVQSTNPQYARTREILHEMVLTINYWTP
jgi:hypothetical protein